MFNIQFLHGQIIIKAMAVSLLWCIIWIVSSLYNHNKYHIGNFFKKNDDFSNTRKSGWKWLSKLFIYFFSFFFQHNRVYMIGKKYIASCTGKMIKTNTVFAFLAFFK